MGLVMLIGIVVNNAAFGREVDGSDDRDVDIADARSVAADAFRGRYRSCAGRRR